jgi:type I restriction enzyme, S subunit
MNKKVKLSEIVKIAGRVGWKGYTVDDLREEGPWVIGANDITTDNRLDLSKAKHISREKYEESPEIKIELNDILIVKVGSTIGKVAIVNRDIGEACINPNSVILKNCKINSSYLYYFLISSAGQAFLRNNSSASAQSALNQLTLKEMLIDLVDERSQENISALLNNLNSKIELNNRINAELEAMAKTLYDYWFVQFDFPDKNGKPYKSSGGKMVWNEELKREVPDLEGWRVGTILDIANYANGLPCQKFRPTGNEYLRVIKIREMNEGFTSNSELVRPNIPERAIIENGDVLFSWSASLEVKIWTGGKGALNQHIFKVTSDNYPISFYYYQLLNYLQHFKMMAENRKTTMGHITQEHLQQSRIAIPTTELTTDLEKIIAPIFSKKMNNEIENQKLTELRDWLLPMLMNGQVKVN